MATEIPTLTFLSYNIKAGQYHRDSLAAVARMIERLAPDIVALQEVDMLARRTGWINQPLWLGQRLGLYECFGPAFQLPTGGLYGNALLSRWPVERSQVYPLAKPPRQTWQARWFGWAGQLTLPDTVWRMLKRTPLLPLARRLNPYLGAEPRVALATTVQTPHGSLPVVVTHFGLQAQERLAQAVELLRIMDASAPSGPLIVAGDFNAQPDSPEIALLRRRLVDVALTVGLTGEARLTFPSGPPGARTPGGWAGAIDYVFVRDLTPLAARVVYDATYASDHQPLISELSMLYDQDFGDRR